MKSRRPLSIITGACNSLGFALARLAADHGHEVIVVDNDPLVAEIGRRLGAIKALDIDISANNGVDELIEAVGPHPIDALIASAHLGVDRNRVGDTKAESNFLTATNVIGTTYLIRQITYGMRERGGGKVLVTGSANRISTSTDNIVCRKAATYLESFALAMREELTESGVTLAFLMPDEAESATVEGGNSSESTPHEPDSKTTQLAAVGYDLMMGVT